MFYVVLCQNYVLLCYVGPQTSQYLKHGKNKDELKIFPKYLFMLYLTGHNTYLILQGNSFLLPHTVYVWILKRAEADSLRKQTKRTLTTAQKSAQQIREIRLLGGNRISRGMPAFKEIPITLSCLNIVRCLADLCLVPSVAAWRHHLQLFFLCLQITHTVSLRQAEKPL